MLVAAGMVSQICITCIYDSVTCGPPNVPIKIIEL